MIDVNIKGVLYGIAAALPIFRTHRFGHFVNIASTAGHKTVPNQSVYSGTKFAVRAISEGLRQEAGDTLRVTIISPGMVRTNFAEGVTSQQVKAQLEDSRNKFAMPPDAIARAIAFAIEQPTDVDVNEIVVRHTAQAVLHLQQRRGPTVCRSHEWIDMNAADRAVLNLVEQQILRPPVIEAAIDRAVEKLLADRI